MCCGVGGTYFLYAFLTKQVSVPTPFVNRLSIHYSLAPERIIPLHLYCDQLDRGATVVERNKVLRVKQLFRRAMLIPRLLLADRQM